MKKVLLFVIAITGIALNGFAQTARSTQLSIGGDFGLPTGQVNKLYGTVIGGSLKLELPVSAKPLSITLTAGITDYLVKLDSTSVYKAAQYLPVEAGAKYYFSRIGYVEGDVGASFNLNGNYTASKTAFIYAPIVGVSAPLYKRKGTIDIGLRYEGRVESGGTISQFALRVAYRFGLK